MCQPTIAGLRLPGLDIVPLTAADRGLYLVLHGDPTTMAHIGEPLDAAAAGRSFDAALAGNARCWPSRWTWAVMRRSDGQASGIVALVPASSSPPCPSAETGAMFLPRVRGQAFAGRSMLALMAFGFEALGLERLTTGHLERNQRAKAVAAKLGFERAASEDAPGVWRWRVERAQWLGWRRAKRLRDSAEAIR